MELPRPLNDNEVVFIQSFTSTAERLAKTQGVFNEFDIYTISQEAGIEVRDLPKEGILIQAIWVSFLSVLRAHLPKCELKYHSMASFLDAYKGQFDDCSPVELQNLMDTANWMNILFRFIPAKKNKGLAIAIIPKLVEGWLTKYVTGSGQKRSTADRVKIFETEGQVKPNQRGKIKPNTVRHSAPINHNFGVALGKPPKAKVLKKDVSYVKKKKSPAPTGMPMMLESQYPDGSYGAAPHFGAAGLYPLQLPGVHNMGSMHDYTDTDHESSEDISHRTNDDEGAYDLDFEASSDLFFNRYEDMMLVNAENPLSTTPMDHYHCEDEDIDFAEVLRLIRDPSTPNLRSSISSQALVRMAGSPRTKEFTSPNQGQSAMYCSSPTNENRNGNTLNQQTIPALRRSVSGSGAAPSMYADVLSSTRVMTGDDDTDGDDDLDDGRMHVTDDAYAQFLSPGRTVM
jgi:hypothetical protein